MKKSDQIMAAYSRSFIGGAGEYKELLDTLVELKENECKEESFIVCSPFTLHVDPDRESPSFFVQQGLPDKRETVAEVFYDGYQWDFWCEESQPELRWRLNNIVWLWNRIDIEEV